VRKASLWSALLGVEKTVVEWVEFDQDAVVVVASVRPTRSAARRCGRCGRRAPRYDAGEGRRRWRSLDLGTVEVYLEADAPRVNCREHGPTVASVPWARHAAGHTRVFDEQVAWLATVCSKSAVTELMRIAWRTVGSIIARVWADTGAVHDLFAGLSRIGIDEISYQRRHKYLTVVTDHDSGRVVWAAPGATKATLEQFFDLLGPGRSALISHVTADAAPWIAAVVSDRCPEAVQCTDPFHVVMWATDALDEVRRTCWNQARRRPGGSATEGGTIRPYRRAKGEALQLKNSRWALRKNPDTLTVAQRAKLDWIAKTDPRLFRAYQLKEGLRLIFQLPPDEAPTELNRWISWARRSRIDVFITLARRIHKHRAGILASIEHGLSNARSESVNTKIRLITRVGFGFASANPLIALIMLQLGGHRPTLPGRS
jgi:transposase